VSFEDKVQQADTIVVADHIGSRSSKDASGRWIVTHNRFRVQQTMKGSSLGEVVVVTPGGTVDGVHQETIGVPKFEPGDRNILFLKQRPDANSILYLDQGTYAVEGEGANALVAPVPSELVLVDMQSGKAMSRQEAPKRLRDFEGAVQKVLSRSEGGINQAAALKADPRRIRTRGDDFKDFFNANKAALAIAALGATLATIAWLHRR
jgi:hypothetical protein